MSRLPVISGPQAVAALERIGYITVRGKGSHIRLRHPATPHASP